MSFARLVQRSFSALITASVIAPVSAAVIIPGIIERPEGTRHYLMAQAGAPGQGKRPLVIVLHGHGSSAATTFGRDRINDPAAFWLDIAEREQLLVIAPDGWKGSDNKQGWNDCRADAPTNPATDDVGFLQALIDKAVAEYGADPQRVYITGGSNGGGMTYRAAIELRRAPAAIAVVSALMPAKSLCAAPSRAVPVLIAHGTGDKIAPYAGGIVSHWSLKGRGSGISAEESVRVWRQLAGLPDTPVVSRFAHRQPSDPTAATRYVWGADPGKLQVVFLKIEQGGHNPPSIARRLSWLAVALVGEQNADLEFAEECWTFFKDKRSPAVAE